MAKAGGWSPWSLAPSEQKPRSDSHWSILTHVVTPEPITGARGMDQPITSGLGDRLLPPGGNSTEAVGGSGDGSQREFGELGPQEVNGWWGR